MRCHKCELVRAKVIAIGMAGLRKPLTEIVAELQKRYGDMYKIHGQKIIRETPTSYEVVYDNFTKTS